MFTKVLMDVGAGEAPTYLLSKHLFLNILSKLPPLCSYFFQFRLFSVEISRAVPRSPPSLAIIQFSNPDITRSLSIFVWLNHLRYLHLAPIDELLFFYFPKNSFCIPGLYLSQIFIFDVRKSLNTRGVMEMYKSTIDRILKCLYFSLYWYILFLFISRT